MRTAFVLLCLLAWAARGEQDLREGYRLLTQKEYLPPDFDQETFDEVWKAWPEPLRSRAAKATPAERRRLAYSRYGLTPRPDDPAKPLQYVVDEKGNWTMSCFACHAGKVAGRVHPGLPNTHFALATLTEEIRATKTRLEKPFGHMDLGSLVIPVGTTNGTTNAVVFATALTWNRDADLNVKRVDSLPPVMDHHDLDAPPWWHFKKRTRLYVDGFAKKDHRPLMQFMLVPQNGPERFARWEKDFREIYRYLESLEAPPYPYPVDRELAAKGKRVFQRSCARCHGTYGGETETYPNKVVPLDEIGTDPVRLHGLTPEQRRAYGKSWFTYKGKHGIVAEPEGYVAPPLDGIWATAPYFHNGSVPTLGHVLYPDRRPRIWRRTEDGYDKERVGLEIQTFDELPASARKDARVRRTYFDTRRRGKGAGGHLFPAELTDEQRRALLEFLKTL